MDQTAKKDRGKPRLTLVPMQMVWDVAEVREWAVANKYKDPDNWKKVEVERYRDALLRHVLRYIQDPGGTDDETGLTHLAHVATNVAFLCELEKNYDSSFRVGNFSNDRGDINSERHHLGERTLGGRE